MAVIRVRIYGHPSVWLVARSWDPFFRVELCCSRNPVSLCVWFLRFNTICSRDWDPLLLLRVHHINGGSSINIIGMLLGLFAATLNSYQMRSLRAAAAASALHPDKWDPVLYTLLICPSVNVYAMDDMTWIVQCQSAIYNNNTNNSALDPKGAAVIGDVPWLQCSGNKNWISMQFTGDKRKTIAAAGGRKNMTRSFIIKFRGTSTTLSMALQCSASCSLPCFACHHLSRIVCRAQCLVWSSFKWDWKWFLRFSRPANSATSI